MNTEELTPNVVKQKVRDKFMTLARFCLVTGQWDNYNKIRYVLNIPPSAPLTELSKQILSQVSASVDMYDNKDLPNELHIAERKMIKDMVYRQYGSVYRFCKRTGLNRGNVHDVIEGRVKHKNPTFHKIMQALTHEGNK